MQAWWLVLVVLHCSCGSSLQSPHTLTHDTPLGRLTGSVQTLHGKSVVAFMSVPYATAARFQEAELHGGWQDSAGVFDATEHSAICSQQLSDEEFHIDHFPARYYEAYRHLHTEDCLRLDIYAPADGAHLASLSLPVLVVIHGGGFAFGASLYATGLALATVGEPVVVVSIQYRLGLFGFLTSGDDVLPGNLGLKDQVVALRWIRQNIAAFGGDPEQVTITGESAGGESVALHMLSPLAKGLFRKASAQSAPLAWIYPEKQHYRKYFEWFAQEQGCEEEGDSARAVECLQGRTTEQLLNTSLPIYMLSQRLVDGQYLVKEPKQAWLDKDYNAVDDFMIGFTSDDGGIFIDYMWNQDFAANRSLDEQIAAELPYVMLGYLLGNDQFNEQQLTLKNGQLLSNHLPLATVAKARYYDAHDDVMDKARGLIDLSTDVYFAYMSLRIADMLAANGVNVRLYRFDYRSGGYPVSEGVRLGAPHGSELPYQFGYALTDPEEIRMSDREVQLTRSFMTAYVTFATSSSAQYLDADGQPLDWPTFADPDPQYLTFDLDMGVHSVRSASEHLLPSMHFWQAIEDLAVYAPPEEASEPAVKEEL